VLVIRHPRDGAAKLAASYANVPVVNGGDGAHEHPTQTLCDLFTLLQEGKNLKNLNVAISGDLKGSRTIHSFVYALARFGANIMLKPEQVARYAARALTVDRLGFAAAGCDDDTALGDALERVLARTGLPATGPAPAAREVGAASGPAVWSADLEGPELTAAVSWRGVAPGDPGRPALAILDCALTWYGGRIFRALREERPLLYSLQTSERWLRGAGTYGMLLSCDPAEAAEALAEIGRIVGDVRRRGLDGDEIDRW